jgi:hypothetical protein
MSIKQNLIAAVAASATLCAIALPAAAEAAVTPTTTIQTHTYHVKVNDGVLAGGQNTITANVKVTNPENTVRRFWSRTTIQQVIRDGVNQGTQMPYQSEGFRCTPVLDGSMNASTARFTCKLQGADVPTTVVLTYSAAYATNAG